MKKLLSVFCFGCSLVLLLYFLLGGFEEELKIFLQSRQHLSTYWIISFAVLASDIFVPVPSSLVMILNGKVLGFLSGTLLSTTSGLLSSLIGFFLGRRSETYIDRFFSNEQQKASSSFFSRFGKSAIMLSKALPIVSEAVSFLSGTTRISFKKFLLFSAAGHLIISAVYAYTGTFSTAVNSNLVSGGIIIAVLLLFWMVDRLVKRKALQQE